MRECPFCNYDDARVHNRTHFIQITCPSCGASGPSADSVDKAVKLWNTRGKRVDWSKVPDGFDWFAIDANGIGFVYREKPICYTQDWSTRDLVATNNDMYHIGLFDAYNWKTSLEQRPEE